MVEPIDPVERGQFDRFDRAPLSKSVDDLGLVETDDRLGQGVIVRVAAAASDTQTMLETLVTAAEQVDAVLPTGPGITELACDKGYHSNQTLVTLAAVGIRS